MVVILIWWCGYASMPRQGNERIFSLGAKKRNGHSPARWRKVSRSQALTGAKETLRAIGDSCPLGRTSVDRLRHLLPPAPVLDTPLLFLSSFPFLAITFVRKDRSRKITAFIASISDWSVEISSILLSIQEKKIVFKKCTFFVHEMSTRTWM